MKENRIEHIRKWNEWFESLSWNQKYLFPTVKFFIIVFLCIIITFIFYFVKYNYIIISIFFVVISGLLYLVSLNSYFDRQYYFPHFFNIYNKFEKVNEILESKVKDGQKDADNLYYVALISYELERYAEAEEYFKELIKRHPEHDWSYIELARCYFKQRRFKDAETLYKKAIEINPNNEVAKDELELTNNTFKEIQQKVCK